MLPASSGNWGDAMKNSKLDCALEAAQHGFRVFPVQPDGKRPLISEWQRWATMDPDKIREWYRSWPDANIGIHTRGLLVVDVDAKHGATIPPDLPATFTVETPSGGWHLYYNTHQAVPNSASKLGKGIDIRGDNGYVLGPGSSIQGRQYVVDSLAWACSNAPDDWVERAAARPVASTGEDHFAEDQQVAIRSAQDYLASHPPAVEGEGGNHHTYATACIVRDCGVELENALEALGEWNARCEPPWSEVELSRVVANAYKYAAGDAGRIAVADPSEFEEIDTEPPAPGKGESLLRTVGDVRKEALENPEYLLKGWLPLKSNAMLFGEWAGGKTFCVLSMSLHIAAGREWFGLRTAQSGVLYCGYEGFHGMDGRMLALQGEYDWFTNDLPLAWIDMRRALVNQGGGMALVNAALREFEAQYGSLPGLVVFDPLRDALGGSDSDPDLTAPYIEYTRELIRRMGCTVLTVHHPGHGDKNRARGDSGVPAAMDTIIQLDKENGTVFTQKQREGKLVEFEYALKDVSLGKDVDGDPITSKVFVQQDSFDDGQDLEVLDAD